MWPFSSRIALPDSFMHDYGSQESLMRSHGISVEQIAATVTKILTDGVPA